MTNFRNWLHLKLADNFGVMLGVLLMIAFVSYSRSENFDWTDSKVETNSAVDLLKMFIAYPPRAGEITFSQRQLFQLPNAKGPSHTAFFVASWQSQNFYLAQIATNLTPNLVNQSNLMDMGGVFDNKPWYNGRGVLKMIEGDPSQNIDMDSQLNRHYYETRFLAAQSFGLMHKPGTLVWDGLQFHAKTYDGEDFRGELGLGEAGMPARISAEMTRNNKPFRFAIDLSYSKSNAMIKLPNSITSEMLEDDGRRIPIEEMHYFSLIFQSVNSSSNEFDPRKILAKIQKPPVLLITSNSESFYLKNGNQIKVGQIEQPISKGHSRIVVVIFAIFSIAFLFSIFYWDQKSKKT